MEPGDIWGRFDSASSECINTYRTARTRVRAVVPLAPGCAYGVGVGVAVLVGVAATVGVAVGVAVPLGVAVGVAPASV